LTPLTRVLLTAVLSLLILCSAFLGLFVGAEHRLSSRVPGTNPGDEKPSTIPPSTIISTTTVITTAQPPGPTSAPEVGHRALLVVRNL
jgi:endothelin-converting enzyme